MSEMTFEAEFAEQDDPVSCIGGSFVAECKKYTITTQKVGTGDACEYENGVESCSPGEGECPEAEVVDGVVVENQGREKHWTIHLKHRLDQLKMKVMVFKLPQGIYNYYPGVLQFEGVGDSTLDCKGVQGGGGDIKVKQAKIFVILPKIAMDFSITIQMGMIEHVLES